MPLSGRSPWMVPKSAVACRSHATTVRASGGRSVPCSSLSAPYGTNTQRPGARNRFSSSAYSGAGVDPVPFRGHKNSGAALGLAPVLNRRAWHGAVRAEHATIAGEGPQPHAAALAIVKEPAGIRRHLLDGLMTALRAGQRGLKLHQRLARSRKGRPIIA
jgi:hypothetical protein